VLESERTRQSYWSQRTWRERGRTEGAAAS
jgi:hypothetical protein